MKTGVITFLSVISALILAQVPAFSSGFVINPYAFPATGGGGGPDTYYYAYGLTDTSYGDGQTSSGWQPQTYNYGTDNLVVSTGGTCTSLGIYARTNGSSYTLKIGLYDGSGNLIVQTSGTVTSTSLVWNDFAVSQAISAGTYTVLYSSSTSDGSYGYDTSNNGVFADGTYAASMIDPHNTLGSDTGYGYSARIYVD